MKKKCWQLARISWLFLFLFSCKQKENADKDKYMVVDSIAYMLNKKAYEYKGKNQKDSAYLYAYKAYKSAQKAKDTFNLYTALLMLSKLDFEAHNFPASEDNAVRALEFGVKEKKKKAVLYNILGINSWKKGNYPEALHYFKKMKEVLGNSFYKDLYFPIMYYNNMGLVSMDKKENEEAISYFDSIIRLKEVRQKEPLKYARALHNKARVLMEMKRSKEALRLAKEALSIREALKNIGGITSSYKFIANYYYQKKDLPKAFAYAKKALKTARNEGNYEEVLHILSLLNKIDPQNAHIYFEKYTGLQKKILEDERRFKEQSAKIRYETQQKENEIARQELIIKQNERVLFIIVLFFAATLILSLALFVQYRKIRMQKNNLQLANKTLVKQKELLNLQNEELEEKNEFIHNLHREMRHRFSDNMGALEATIGQLLKNPEHDDRINHLLKKISGKITEIRLIQELLKYQGNSEAVNMKEFTEKLVSGIQNIFDTKKVKVNIEVDPVFLDITQSKSLGAIINEFLTNSLKYAFKEGESGEVSIKIKEKKPDLVEVHLSDNGKGIPADMDFSKLKSRGIILIGLFIKKLKAKLLNPEKKYLFNTDKGVKIAFIFKKNKLK